MPLHNIFPTKFITVWFIQKWMDDGSFFGQWEWVQDCTSKREANKIAKQLTNSTNIKHRVNSRTDQVRI